MLYCHCILLFYTIAAKRQFVDQSTWLTLTQYAPHFSRSLTEYAPHIRHFLLRPTVPAFTVFAPVDAGCSVDEFSKGLGQSVDAVFRYHVASAISVEEGDGGEVVETGLEGQGRQVGEAVLCHLPIGHRQRVKVYWEGGVMRVFDGELPPAKVINVLECRDGGVIVLMDRTLFPPLVVPGSVKDGTPTKAILESILQFGIADYRTSPLTIFAPANYPSTPFLLDTHLSAHYVVPGVFYSEDFRDGLQLVTYSGTKLVFTDDGHDFMVNKIKIRFYDVPTSFGVVHVIEGPLVSIEVAGPEPETAVVKIVHQNGPIRTPHTISALSTPACFMLAGAVAVCMAFGYAAYRSRVVNYVI